MYQSSNHYSIGLRANTPRPGGVRPQPNVQVKRFVKIGYLDIGHAIVKSTQLGFTVHLPHPKIPTHHVSHRDAPSDHSVGRDQSTRSHRESIRSSTNARLQVSIPVSTKTDEWISAEVLRDDFIHSQRLQDTIDVTNELEDSSEATAELFALFLAFIAKHINSDPSASSSRASLLYNSLKHFSASYLSSKDIHTLAASFDTDVRKTVLASYFQALVALEIRNIPDIPRPPQSALLTASQEGDASIFALFGGQGTNDLVLDELQSLYDIYTPYVAPFVEAMTTEVLIPLASSSQSPYYQQGLNVSSWLSGSSPRPPLAYQTSIPVSLPLIGLVQLAQYLVAFKVASLTPGEFVSRLAGATGHSQGIITATAISASTSYESFVTNSQKTLKWLFFTGLRAQIAFPILSVEPSIIADSLEGGEGFPSTMLSVVGLLLKELTPHIEKTNKHLPENSQLGMSLHNGIKAFVVTGPARALHGLVTSLRKIRAPAGLDQSKIPFSQRKATFFVRYLGIGAPFHSPYLSTAVDQFLEEDLEGKEMWTAKELQIPVYNTYDGEHFSYKFLNAVLISCQDPIFEQAPPPSTVRWQTSSLLCPSTGRKRQLSLNPLLILSTLVPVA